MDAGGRPAHHGGVPPIAWWGGLSRRRRLLVAVLALVVVAGGVSDPANRYVPDTGRLSRELEFSESVPLDIAIFRTAAWYRAQLNRSMPS